MIEELRQLLTVRDVYGPGIETVTQQHYQCIKTVSLAMDQKIQTTLKHPREGSRNLFSELSNHLNVHKEMNSRSLSRQKVWLKFFEFVLLGSGIHFNIFAAHITF